MVTKMSLDLGNAVKARDLATNPLVALIAQGQSMWLDNITRQIVRGGTLKELIETDGLRGMTSNPTIFQKAISSSADYDSQIRQVAAQGQSPDAIFEAIAVQDVQEACDVFRPLYDSLDGADGFVSIEVSPGMARDTQGTITEARRLWVAVNRPNVMVKVPGTVEGAEAVGVLLQEGININITLLFSIENHERVMWKYVEAVEARAAAGKPIKHLASVASFFVSRVDTLIDKQLDEKIKATNDSARQEMVRGLKGKAAVANAKLAYARFREIFDAERFTKLKAQGARVQRPLWASTSAKNPAYRDVIYVEELIGSETVNTMPDGTIAAFKDHGKVARTVDAHLDEARATMDQLKAAGIDYEAVTKQLENEGIASFSKSFDELLAEIAKKKAKIQA